jgi:hypothetical protein
MGGGPSGARPSAVGGQGCGAGSVGHSEYIGSAGEVGQAGGNSHTGYSSHSGQYNTIGGQILQSNGSTAAAITYQFSLVSGQVLSPGTNWLFAAQSSGNGTVHPTAGDTYVVTYTIGGVAFSQTGHF